MKKHVVGVMVVVSFLLAAAPSTRPTSTWKNGADRVAVRAAVAALTKEFARGEARVNSTYFKDHPAKDVSDEAIVAEISAPFANARQGAYVRWQLLSGLSDEPDEKTIAALRRAYRAAPPPLARPGVAPSEQQKLDQMLLGKTVADEAEIKRHVELMFEAAEKENRPMLAYRDELYRRLPKDLETFAAALTDLWARMNAVADGKDLVKAFAADVMEWATTQSPPPQQLAALADAVRKLADSKGPQYYSSASWRPSSRKFAWTKSRSPIDSGKTLKELAALLEEQSRQPALTLESKK